jgi:lysozyme
MANHFTEEALALLKDLEGFKAEPYLCSGNVLTIGYGHTSKAGLPFVVEGMRLTEPEAEGILLRDLLTFEDAVRRLVRARLTDTEFSACVILCFNIGEGNFGSSTMLRRLNAGDREGALEAWGWWTYADGEHVPGLATRRAREIALFRGRADPGS